MPVLPRPRVDAVDLGPRLRDVVLNHELPSASDLKVLLCYDARPAQVLILILLLLLRQVAVRTRLCQELRVLVAQVAQCIAEVLRLL